MKPRPNLRDMPDLVKLRITGHLEEYYEKMSLQTVFPNFRPFIGDLHFDCDRFMLTESGGWIQMKFHKGPKVFNRTYMEMEKAVNDFKMLVENPNFSIQALKVEEALNPRFLSKIGSVLANLKIRVKHLRIIYNGDQKDLLRFLGSLEGLKLLMLEKGPLNQEKVFPLDEVMKLEQWKRLEIFEFFDYEKNALPMELWWKNLNPRAKLAKVKLVDLKRIVEFFRKAPDFDSYELETKFSDHEIARAMRTSNVRFIGVDDGISGTFPRTPTKCQLHVDVRDGRIQFNRRSDLEKQGYNFDRIYPMGEDTDEDVDDHFDSRRALEDLKLKFCDSIKEPVMVGMDEGVVKHFEWDREKKTYRKRSCKMCKGDVEMFKEKVYYY